MSRLYSEEKLTRGEIARRFGTSVQTVTRMLLKQGQSLEARTGSYSRGSLSDEHKQKISAARAGKGVGERVERVERECEVCPTVFLVTKSNNRQRFCSRACRNRGIGEVNRQAALAQYEASPQICPCGEKIPFEFRHTRQFCSDACRWKHQDKRQPDPENYVTFACENCGTEVTRRKTYGNGYTKYCSNACAKRHTKTRRNIVIRDGDTVLDSSWEALVWGLCCYRKIPIERFDRAAGVEWREDQWYAPDFILPTVGTALEVKGQQDPEDHLKWQAYRDQQGGLVVIDEPALEALLRVSSDKIALVAQLRELASRPILIEEVS
jgi:hypothetical protein